MTDETKGEGFILDKALEEEVPETAEKTHGETTGIPIESDTNEGDRESPTNSTEIADKINDYIKQAEQLYGTADPDFVDFYRTYLETIQCFNGKQTCSPNPRLIGIPYLRKSLRLA